MEDKLYLWIAYALFAIFIVLWMISYLNNQFTNSGFIRDYAARDLSLFFDAVKSSKGSLTLDYDIDSFNIEVDDNNIYVEDPELDAVSKYAYTAYYSKHINFDKELVLCRLNLNYDNGILIIQKGDCS